MGIINVNIDLKLNDSGIKALQQNFAQMTQTVNQTTESVRGLNQKLRPLGKIQGLAAVSMIFTNTSSAVKSLAADLEKAVGWAGAYADRGDRIAKTSRLVGLSAKEYQALDSAARHAGMRTEEMDAALRKLNVTLFKARSGDAAALKPFESLLPKALSAYKDNSEIIRALAGSYAKLESAEQRAFVSQSLFGEGGLRMSELLSQGEESLGKYIDGYEAAFSDEGARNAEAFNDSLQDMRESVDALKMSVAQELFPVFTETFASVRAFLKSDEGKEKFAAIKSAVVGLVDKVLPKIPKALDIALSVVNAIGPGVTVAIAAFVALLPVLGQVAMLIGAFLNFFADDRSVALESCASCRQGLPRLVGCIENRLRNPRRDGACHGRPFHRERRRMGKGRRGRCQELGYAGLLHHA